MTIFNTDNLLEPKKGKKTINFFGKLNLYQWRKAILLTDMLLKEEKVSALL